MPSKISYTCPWVDFIRPHCRASVSVTSSEPHSLPLQRWVHQIVHAGPCTQCHTMTTASFCIRSGSCQKAFLCTDVIALFPPPTQGVNIHWKWQGECADVPTKRDNCWVGNSPASGNSIKPHRKSERPQADQTKPVATATKTHFGRWVW